jgi:hypothetical protein
MFTGGEVPGMDMGLNDTGCPFKHQHSARSGALLEPGIGDCAINPRWSLCALTGQPESPSTISAH